MIHRIQLIYDTEYMVQDKGLHDAGLRIQNAVFRNQKTQHDIGYRIHNSGYRLKETWNRGLIFTIHDTEFRNQDAWQRMQDACYKIHDRCLYTLNN